MAPQAPPGWAVGRLGRGLGDGDGRGLGGGLGLGEGLGVVPLPLQVPKVLWQPAPQWAVVVPHQPYCEQHWPLGQMAVLAPQAPPEGAVGRLGRGEGLGLGLGLRGLGLGLGVIVVGLILTSMQFWKISGAGAPAV